MKKLAALVLSFGMLFSMAACSGSKVSDEALDQFEASIKKFSEVTSANYSADMDMTMDEEQATIKLHGGFVTETKKPIQLSMTMDMEASGQTINDYIQLYLKDDIMYMNVMGFTKQKTSLTDAMGTQELPNMNFDTDTFKIDKEAMKEYLEEASLDGNDLKLSFDTKKLNEKFKEEMEDNSISDGTVEIGKMDMDMTLKDDFIEKTVITMEITSKQDEITQKINATITFTMSDINKVTNLTFPDFTDYVEQAIE